MYGSPVNALVAPFISCFSTGNCLSRIGHFRIDFVDEPLETLALKLIPKLLPGADISKVAKVVSDTVVVILFIVVQPNLRNFGLKKWNVEPTSANRIEFLLITFDGISYGELFLQCLR